MYHSERKYKERLVLNMNIKPSLHFRPGWYEVPANGMNVPGTYPDTQV